MTDIPDMPPLVPAPGPPVPDLPETPKPNPPEVPVEETSGEPAGDRLHSDPIEHERHDPATHVKWGDSTVEFVHSDDYEPDELVPIDPAWLGPFMVPDYANQTFVPDLSAAYEGRKAEIEARAASTFLLGFTVPAGTSIAGQHLQLRDETDRTNWLASAHVYGAMVAAGQGAVAGATFRTAENETVTISFAEGHQILMLMQAWGGAIMACSWRLKDTLAAALLAEDFEAIMAIDVESESWPS